MPFVGVSPPADKRLPPTPFPSSCLVYVRLLPLFIVRGRVDGQGFNKNDQNQLVADG